MRALRNLENQKAESIGVSRQRPAKLQEGEERWVLYQGALRHYKQANGILYWIEYTNRQLGASQEQQETTVSDVGVEYVKEEGVTGDGLVFTLKAGYDAGQLYVQNDGNADITIDLGTSSGGSQIVKRIPVKANNQLAVNVGVLDKTANTGVYVSDIDGDDSWGTASLNFYARTQQVIT